MNFTKQEKINALTRLGYTIKEVDAYCTQTKCSFSVKTVKVLVALWGEIELNIDTDITVSYKYGIDNVFEKEYKRLILELFQR